MESLRRELDLAIKIRKKFKGELVSAFQMCENLRRQLDFGLKCVKISGDSSSLQPKCERLYTRGRFERQNARRLHTLA